MMKYLQKLGKALMLPVAVLPICGILMGLGYALAPGVMGVPGAATSGAAYTVGFLLVKAGGALIDNMAWLFAIGAAVGLADDHDGTAGLAGLVSYLMMQQLLSPGVVSMVRTLEEGTATYIAFQKVAGNSFIGILAAVVGAACYNKFKSTQMPDWLAFFSGKRFVAIATGLISIVVSVALLFVWPVIFDALVAIGNGIEGMDGIGAGIYAFLNRLLIPTGLHHALNNVFWFDTIGLGDLSHFWAGETSADVGWSLFYFRGNRNLNISVDYLLKNKLIKFYGETALSRNGAVASLNALQLTPASYFSLLLLYRYYDKRYQAFFGNAFSQNSAVRNEQGMYIGMQWTPFARWKLSAYADVFRFPWLKYGVDAPSTGKEYMLQLDYTPSRNLSVYVRYKYKQRENITPYHQQRLRMQALYTISSSVSLRTSADGICYTEANEKSRGWMIAQSVGWKPVDVPVQTDFHIAGFHTDNYRTRISSYEKNILYAFNMPSFYGKGVRLALSFRWDIVKQLSVSAKLGYTYYADRDVVGTDLEEIEGNIKADIYTLLRWKF